MKFTTVASALLGASAALAAPARSNPFKRAGNMLADAPTDTQVLQYALTLEHLEATF